MQGRGAGQGGRRRRGRHSGGTTPRRWAPSPPCGAMLPSHPACRRPQHHRPSTFMPCDVHIEREADGAVTVWCSEHEPMNRMKVCGLGINQHGKGMAARHCLGVQEMAGVPEVLGRQPAPYLSLALPHSWPSQHCGRRACTACACARAPPSSSCECGCTTARRSPRPSSGVRPASQHLAAQPACFAPVLVGQPQMQRLGSVFLGPACMLRDHSMCPHEQNVPARSMCQSMQVGQRGGACARPVPILLPAGCALRGRRVRWGASKQSYCRLGRRGMQGCRELSHSVLRGVGTAAAAKPPQGKGMPRHEGSLSLSPHTGRPCQACDERVPALPRPLLWR